MQGLLRRRSLAAFISAGMLFALLPGPQATADNERRSQARAGTFDALSYNVAGLFGPISGSDPEENSPLISPLLNDYDLVLLQESWGDPLEQEGIERPHEAIPDIHYHHQVVAEADHPYRSEPAPHPWGTDLRRAPRGPTLIADGLNRLSRFPFEALTAGAGGTYDNTADREVTRVMWRECFGDLALVVAEEALAATGQEDTFEDLGLMGHEGPIDGGSADCGAQKGFSVSRTELAPGVEVDVYNLHADAGGHVNDVEARRDNFAQLAEFIVEHSEGRAVILGGDTNLRTTSHTREERRVVDEQVWTDFQEATGLVDVCVVLRCDLEELRDEGISVHDKFAFRSGGGVELKPLSFAYEREKFSRADGEPLSDHDPLTVTFHWRTGG